MRGAALRVAGQHAVQALRGEGQLVFEQDTGVLEFAFCDDTGHGPQGVLPGAYLAVGGPESEMGEELIRQLIGDLIAVRVA